MTSVVAVLGTGTMGEAILAGLLRSGRPASEVLATARRPERAAQLREQYGVEVVDNATAASRADVLLLCPKPYDMAALLEQIAPSVDAGALVVSAAAGLPSSFYEERLPAGIAVVRAMPNTPSLVGEGMTVLSAGAHATAEHLAAAEALFAPVGRTLVLPEKQQDAASAVSGSGPAYFYFLVEAMTEAGILLGLPRATAFELAAQTAVGAGLMLRDTGEHPTVLRERVMSPGGTTIRAIRTLEDHGVRGAVIAALEAAHERSQELARG